MISRKMNVVVPVPVPVQIYPVRKEGEGREEFEEEDETVLPSQCSVCTGPAGDHKHYGAVSCYSCRYIFKRIKLRILTHLPFQSLLSARCAQADELRLWEQPV